MVLERHGPRIRGVIAKKYRCRLGSDFPLDIVEETFTRYWAKGRFSYDPSRAPLASFLCKIALNAAADQARRQPAHYVDPNVIEGAVAGTPADDVGEADQGLFHIRKRRLLAAIRNAVNELPDRFQRVIRAYAENVMEGKLPTSPEVAARLKMNERTVRVYRRRGIQRINEAVERAGFGPPEEWLGQ
jgi:RNA polymerase sigma factor (sigma-70 family)